MIKRFKAAWLRIRKIALMPDEVMGVGVSAVIDVDPSGAPVHAKVSFSADTHH